MERDDQADRSSGNATPKPIDLEGAVRNALANRIDLAVASATSNRTNISEEPRNQTLPDLNLIGLYNLQGRGGTISSARASAAIIGTIPGGYFDALSNIGTFDAPTWSVRLNFTYPIGQSSAEGRVRAARVQVTQTQAQIKQAELLIATEVTNAALNVRNTLEAMQAAAVARELSEQRLQAAQSKFEVGMATNFEVVQAQRDLADARNIELRKHPQLPEGARRLPALAAGRHVAHRDVHPLTMTMRQCVKP